MDFICGLFLGVVAVLAVRRVLPVAVSCEEPSVQKDNPTPHDWQDTHNFLYYDGTVMPKREETNE